jgi:hypothetical protein
LPLKHVGKRRLRFRERFFFLTRHRKPRYPRLAWSRRRGMNLRGHFALRHAPTFITLGGNREGQDDRNCAAILIWLPVNFRPLRRRIALHLGRRAPCWPKRVERDRLDPHCSGARPHATPVADAARTGRAAHPRFQAARNDIVVRGRLTPLALGRGRYVNLSAPRQRTLNRQGQDLGQRFLGSNHIRRRRRVCMTKCG